MTPQDPLDSDFFARIRRQTSQSAGLSPASDAKTESAQPAAAPPDLDSALKNLAVVAAAKEASAKTQEIDNAKQRERFQALVDDFRRRMSALGNPGTDWSMKEGLFRKVCGWRFAYDDYSMSGLPVTEDGRIPSFVKERPGEYVRPIDSQFTPSDDALRRLTFKMAELVRRYGG